MVKLGWIEEFAINIVVAVILYFLIINYIDTTSWALWVWIIVLIIYFGISSIIIKLIKGKEVLSEEEKRDKEREERINKKIESFSLTKWWKRQKEWVQIVIIVFCVFALTLILLLLDI